MPTATRPLIPIWGAPMSGADLFEIPADDPRQSPDRPAALLVMRDPRTAVGALMAAWESRTFALDPQPEGWWGEPWSFELVDGWEGLLGRPLSVVCARQWLLLQCAAIRAAQQAADDPGTLAVTSYEELVEDPTAARERLVDALGSDVRVRLSSPGDPWRRPHDLGEVNAGLAASEPLLREYLSLASELGYPGYADALPAERRIPGAVTTPGKGTRFESDFTVSVPQLLASIQSSLLITTYKAGQVVIARTGDGTGLDTHFTAMDRPMGIALAGNRCAVGAADSVVVYSRYEVGASLELEPVPDAVWVPKAVIFTGDVSIHDMAWDLDGVLWFVNTKFSCLSTLQPYSSFDAAWVPPWISQLAAEDRCHLNGLAMVDGRPGFVSALATTDAAGQWRQHRGTGGVIADVATGEVVAAGLSMPHSPRWHDGLLWFVQSGIGSLNHLDPASGLVVEVCRLPGFPRGLAFVGPYALVGLSQVRESVFEGLPVTTTATARNCGVWIVDTRSGTTVGFLRFTGAVTEIFDVQLLPARWPHIADAGDLTRSCYALEPDTLERLQPGPRNQGAT